MGNVYTVSQINRYIKDRLNSDQELSDLWVKGEISNFKFHYSGHMYFTLKDESSVIKAVMFKSQNSALKFAPEDGMKVIARGAVNVFERDGQYQLYVTEIVPDGVGDLYKAFEQLKEKLEKEGLFEEKYKKPIPFLPSSVAVITSTTGAVIRDIVNVISRRFPETHIKIFPVAVQGAGAAAQISAAIETVNRHRSADVIIIARGGGSLEDLWPFNEESVARSIYGSRIPVISAIGHQTDYTIADFVADLRAPTPSAAAELVVQEKNSILATLHQHHDRINLAIGQIIADRRKKLDNISAKTVFSRPADRINQERLHLDSLLKDLAAAALRKTTDSRTSLSVAVAGLNAMSPLAILSRGYSVTARKDEAGFHVIRSVNDTKIGDSLEIMICDGKLDCTVDAVRIDKEEE